MRAWRREKAWVRGYTRLHTHIHTQSHSASARACNNGPRKRGKAWVRLACHFSFVKIMQRLKDAFFQTLGYATTAPTGFNPVCVQCLQPVTRDYITSRTEGLNLTFCTQRCCYGYWEEYGKYGKIPPATAMTEGELRRSQIRGALDGFSPLCRSTHMRSSRLPQALLCRRERQGP